MSRPTILIIWHSSNNRHDPLTLNLVKSSYIWQMGVQLRFQADAHPRIVRVLVLPCITIITFSLNHIWMSTPMVEVVVGIYIFLKTNWNFTLCLLGLIPHSMGNSLPIMGPPTDILSRGQPLQNSSHPTSYSFTPTSSSSTTSTTCLPNIQTQSGPLPPMVSQMTWMF